MRRPAILALCLALGGCSSALNAQVNAVNGLKIKDAVSDYERARDGAPLDRCVKAKLVAIAYEDAKDAGNASAWRAREREDCQAAIAATGIERPAQPATRPGT
jgi:uncharacterized protein YgiB involved in biofilm formation